MMFPTGALVVLCVYLSTAFLCATVPGRVVNGYACDKKGQVLRYRLNGLQVLLIQVGAWWGLCQAGVLDATLIARNFWGCLFAANVAGLLGSAYFCWSGLSRPLSEQEQYLRCPTVDTVVLEAPAKDVDEYKKRTVASHFFLGVEFNPRIGTCFDVKMFLYLVGAVML